MSFLQDLGRISAIGSGELSEANIDAICQLYEGLVVANVDIGTVDLAAPLFQAISNRMDQKGFESVHGLCDALSVLLWNLLIQKGSHLRGKDLLSVVSDNNIEIANIASKINTVDNDILLNLYLYEAGKCPVFSFLKLLSDFHTPFVTLVRQLEKEAKETLIPGTFEDHLIDLVSLMKSNKESELASLLLIDQKSLLEALSIFRKSKLLSEMANKCVERVFEILEYFLPKYPQLASPYFEQVNFHLDTSFRFILEMLDHGLNLDYLQSNSILSSLARHCFTINEHIKRDKLKCYKTFNKLNSKISFSAMTIYLNFLLSVNMMYEWKTFPKLILSKFELMQLPPLPKSGEFFPKPKTKDFFGNDCASLQNTSNYNYLALGMTTNLETMSHVIRDEFEALKIINTYSTDSIQQKMVRELSDFMISSLTATLVATRNQEGYVKDRIVGLVHNNIHTLLDSSNMQWVNLLDFANDLCYSDLHCILILESLFDLLIQKNPDILQSSLVSSGLKFFIRTFAPHCTIHGLGDPAYREGTKELLLDDYNYIYNSHKPAEPQSSTPVTLHKDGSRNYATNSARQQSIHVDEYGRN